jgi:hypothetical protein
VAAVAIIPVRYHFLSRNLRENNALDAHTCCACFRSINSGQFLHGKVLQSRVAHPCRSCLVSGEYGLIHSISCLQLTLNRASSE